MKKFIGLALVALIALAGCAHDVNPFEPIVGTWKDTAGIVDTTLVFNNDKSASITNTVAGWGTNDTGTWSSSSTTITVDWAGSADASYTYTFSSDNKEMTLNNGLGSVTFKRS